jgi:hypothetical protein
MYTPRNNAAAPPAIDALATTKAFDPTKIEDRLPDFHQLYYIPNPET